MRLQDPAVPDGAGVSEYEWSVEETAQALIAAAVEEVETAEPIPAEEATTPELAEAFPRPPVVPRPVIPKLPMRRRIVSGRYRGRNGTWELELRVDVDGRRPMNRVSGDFYSISGGTVSYFGSFIVDSPVLSVAASTVTIRGIARTTWATPFNHIRITIPRVLILQPPADATITFSTGAGQQGATYVCRHESGYFRSVQLEMDCVQGVAPFDSYNTGSLPSGGAARTLTIPSAFQEAGIDMQMAGAPNAIPLSEAGPNQKWSDAELHASMERHFSLWRDAPQWKVWLLAAYEHELGPGLYGIMFDQKGKQRQGCAVFHRGIGGAAAEQKRLQLYTYVHELGHCFNLLHSWQKQYATPPAPNRPASLSWMNYPWYFPGGPAAFWGAFPFQFDDLEVVHLRHAFLDDVIPGGKDFTKGAALTDGAAFDAPLIDQTRLKLELEAKKSFAYGEPVVVEIKLYTMSLWEQEANVRLHPNAGYVQIAIRKPNGDIVTFEPLLEHCAAPEVRLLDEQFPSAYESAYVGFGKDGLYFDQVGRYQVRALYHAPDGSTILSNILNLFVRAPLNETDQIIAEMLLDEQVGTLFALLGSDSETLRRGNAVLDMLINEYPSHPLTLYARLAKGVNAAREFKIVTPDSHVAIRAAQPEESVKLLQPVVDASEKDPMRGLDNITLGMTMITLAHAQKAMGNTREAKATAKRMESVFEKRVSRKHVLQQIAEQARSI